MSLVVVFVLLMIIAVHAISLNAIPLRLCVVNNHFCEMYVNFYVNNSLRVSLDKEKPLKTHCLFFL